MVVVLPILAKNAVRITKKPIATLSLITLTLYLSLQGFQDTHELIRRAFCPATFRNEPATILLYAFYHTGTGPLVVNLVCLWVFGKSLEETTSHWFFVFTALTSSVLYLLAFSLIKKDPFLGVVGLSGIVSGVMGAAYATCRRTSVVTLTFVFVLPLIVEMSLTWLVYYLLAAKAAVIVLNHLHPDLPSAVLKAVSWFGLPIASSVPFLWGCLVGTLYSAVDKYVVR